MKLTPKQKKFAEYYIKCGNATEAARLAGYSDKTARVIGTENLSKPAISEYIAGRRAEMDKTLIADSDEVLRFYSAVMRGEVKDQFGLDAALGDRLKAGDSLMKRYAVSEKNTISEQMAEDPLTKALKEEAERMEENANQ